MKKKSKEDLDNFFKNVFKQYDKLEKTSSEIDNKIINIFNNTNLENVKTVNNFIQPNQNLRFLRLGFALVILFMLIPVILFFLNKTDFFNKDRVVIAKKEGEVFRIKKGYYSNLVDNIDIDEKDIIKTGENSRCEIQIGESISILLYQKSMLDFKKFSSLGNKININLISGKTLINVEKESLKKQFFVETDHIAAQIIGTKFIIETDRNKSTFLAVKEGEVQAVIKNPPKDIEYNFMIKSGESIKIGKDKFDKSRIDSKYESDFSYKFNVPILIEEDKRNKKGDITWGFKKIYNFNYPEDNTKNKILSFVPYKDYIITLTEVSIMCFDKKNKLIWQNVYGREKKLFFMSEPIVRNNKIYLTTINNKFLILDLKTGNLIKKFNTPGNVTFGNKMIYLNNNFYIPYRNGIYRLSEKSPSLEKEPYITFQNPSTPIFNNDNFYIYSFVDPIISCFDKYGSKQWDYTLENVILTEPLFYDNSIYIFDVSGNLYKLSLEGGLLNRVKLPFGNISVSKLSNESVFTLGNDGSFYKIDLKTNSYNQICKVDEDPLISSYIYKKPVIDKNNIFIGSQKGEVIIYSINRNIIKSKLNISDYPISASIVLFADNYYVGSNNGEIWQIKFISN